ncbi:hypothetical protein MTR_7g006700 [Medicago truncatula]|uniref:Uncharacterized protein n=1 Tax=Medicago truncatula TaxID=3880 RepID=G7KXS3_MEDTR|nr:hypothetical protein MTR_7g006700 [Medicago truncatula]
MFHKRLKSNSGGWHGRANASMGRAKLLTLGETYFVFQSLYFRTKSAPSPFLLLQDSIHPIFIPEI